ncbi:unnamed protein product [Lampetra fluviatilis]
MAAGMTTMATRSFLDVQRDTPRRCVPAARSCSRRRGWSPDKGRFLEDGHVILATPYRVSDLRRRQQHKLEHARPLPTPRASPQRRGVLQCSRRMGGNGDLSAACSHQNGCRSIGRRGEKVARSDGGSDDVDAMWLRGDFLRRQLSGVEFGGQLGRGAQQR